MKAWMAAGLVCLLYTGCAAGKDQMSGEKAVAKLSPASGSTVSGTIEFIGMNGYVLVKADVQGLTPGKHGFHVHEKGDCSDPKAMSAGGHFNPEKTQHGAPDAMPHHAGDMGNLMADSTGHATLEWKDKDLSFDGPHSILGRAVIVHAGADDLKSQPVGNAGGRVACGVIEKE
jgi:Cu-Zn family superoxide dismutase